MALITIISSLSYFVCYEKHLPKFLISVDVTMLIRVVTLTSRLTKPVFCRSANSQWFTSKDVYNFNWLFRSLTTSRYCKNNKNGYHVGQKSQSTVYYVVALGVLVGGLSYAAVPLYRLFCQVQVFFFCFLVFLRLLISIVFSPTAMEVQHRLLTMLKVWRKLCLTVSGS